MTDLATKILEIANALGEPVQIQCIPRPDWPRGYWFLYVGTQKVASHSDLKVAVHIAEQAVLARVSAAGGM